LHYTRARIMGSIGAK